ncbi:MAG: nuclear transport factor 2 family protein [Gemmatimonadota bacterium]
MRRSVLRSLLLAPLAACQPADYTGTPFSETDRAAVASEAAQAIEQYVVAIRSADMDAMLFAWGDVEGFALAADGELITSHADLARDLEEGWANVDRMLEFETSNPHTYVLGPDAASHTLEYRWTMLSVAGDTVRSHGTWLYVVKRLDSGWKIVQSAGTHLYDEGE